MVILHVLLPKPINERANKDAFLEQYKLKKLSGDLDKAFRDEFRVISLIDGKRTNFTIAILLGKPISSIHDRLFALQQKGVVRLEMKRVAKINLEKLVSTYNQCIAPYADEFASEFYSLAFKNERVQFLFNSRGTDMQKQKKALVGMLNIIIAGASRGEDLTTSNEISQLGERHRKKYNINRGDFAVIGEALILSLKTFIPSWDETLSETWLTIYESLTETMLADIPPKQASAL